MRNNLRARGAQDMASVDWGTEPPPPIPPRP